MDVAGVIYEIDPSRAEQGARRAIAALDGLEKRTDAFIAKAKALQRQLSGVLSFSDLRGNSSASATQILNKIESDFARHNQRLVEMAAKNATKLQEIEAKKNAALVRDRERAAARTAEADRKILSDALNNAAKLQQIQAGNTGKLDVSNNRRIQAQIQADGKILLSAQNNAAKLQAIAIQGSSKLNQIELKRIADVSILRERFALREEERQRREAEKLAKIQAAGFAGAFRRYASTIREAGESLQQTGYFLTGLSTSLIAVGSAAIKSAVDIDKNVNVLKSLLGSADAAERRFKQLTALSQATPGLTTGLAATLDAQLRVAGATEKAINRVLPAIGKLNAVSNLQDPQRFAQNLIQLVTQDFERIDLKELVGQSPLAGELIKQVFNVDSATNAKAIRESARKLGITTVDSFFDALGAAAEKNQKLAGITESLSTRFAKLADRVTIALRPLGVAIVDSLEPIVSRGVEILERLGKAFSDLPSGVKQAILLVGGLTVALGPLVVGIGAVVQAIGAIGNLSAVAAGLGGLTTAFAGLSAGIVPIGAAVLAVTAALGLGVYAWREYGASANDAISLTSIASSELSSITSAADSLFDVIVKLNDTINGTFALKQVLGFNSALEGTAIAIAAIKDIAELLYVSFTAWIKLIVLGLEGPLQKALKLIGVSIKGLDDDVNRLVGDLDQLSARSNAGFSNVRATQDRIAQQQAFSKLTPERQSQAALFLGDTFQTPSSVNTTPTRDYVGEARSAIEQRNRRAASRTRSGGSKSKEVSELEQLQKQLSEINKDIASFSNVKSPEFNLRIQLEDARRFKGELERIVTLRRELNEPLKAPLPTTKEGAQREIERLESLKKLNETIAKIDVFGPLAESAQKSQEAFAAQIQQLDKLISDSLPQTEAATVSAAIAQNEFFQSLLKTNPALAEYYRQQAAAADATIRTADAAKQFAQLQDDLAGRLERFQSLSNEQALSLQLQAESYKNLSDAQRQQLLDLARQIDEQEQIKAQTEELRQQAEESQRAFDAFYGRVTDLFSTLYERGPKAFFDQMLSTLKRTLAQMAAELTTSAIFRLLGFKGGGGGDDSGGGGGLLGRLFGGGSGGNGGGGGGGLFGRLLGGGRSSGGSFLGNLFGGSKAGAGNFLTGGFAGGNPAQSAISKATGGGAGLLGKVPGLGFLGKLPVLGSLFGGGGAGLAGAAAGAGGTGAFAGATAGASAGGGSLFASLGALFSNPITAVVAGAVIGGIFLFKSLRNRTEKALRKLIRSEYEVDVKSMQVLKQVKDLGDQAFKGQGGAKKNQLQTIKLPEAKQLIADYAVQTGQNDSKLVREIELQRELQDPTSSQNRFRRFATGGRFTAGPAIVGDGGRPEVVVFGGSGEVFPSIREFEKQLLEALQSSKVLGGIFGGVRQQLISQLQNRAQSAAPQTERFAAGRMDRAIAAVGRAVGQLAEQFSRFETAPADSVIQKVASDKPEIFTEATDRGLAAGGQRVNSFQQRLGLA